MKAQKAAQAAEYYKKNRGVLRAKAREYYERNKKFFRADAREYYADNRERLLIMNRERARKRVGEDVFDQIEDAFQGELGL